MKKLIVTAAGLLLTTSAFASSMTVQNHATFKTDSYSSKTEAYNAGFELADSVKEMDQGQLKFQLPVQSYTLVKNISVDNSQVAVEEFSTTAGETQYRAIVDLGYKFDAKDD